MIDIYNDTRSWTLIDLEHLHENGLSLAQTSGIICLMLYLRTLIYLLASPMIKFIIELVFKILKNIQDIMIVLIVFVISFSLIFHILTGPESIALINIFNTILSAIISFLGGLNGKDLIELSLPKRAIIVSFLIIVKFILFTFLYAIISETFVQVKAEFSNYKKREHYKLVKGTTMMFLRYLFVPISFIFMFRDFKEEQSIYGNKDIKNLVDEGTVINYKLNYQTMIVDRRIVYIVFDPNKKKLNY